MKSLSRVRLLATPWTAAYQALPSMGFSRQEYRSGVPLPSPIYNANTKQKKAELSMLIADRSDFRAKEVIRDKDGTLMKLKVKR